jgi:hypothetical protein
MVTFDEVIGIVFFFFLYNRLYFSEIELDVGCEILGIVLYTIIEFGNFYICP